jgi:hypothetical protein
VIAFYERYDTNMILGSWWKEDNKFVNSPWERYAITGLREPYMYAMIMLCKLYGERDYSQFSEAWIPLAYHVVMWGRKFNWGGIISKQLSLRISQAQSPQPGAPPTFHMVSFLLDVLCAQNTFPGLSLSWTGF